MLNEVSSVMVCVRKGKRVGGVRRVVLVCRVYSTVGSTCVEDEGRVKKAWCTVCGLASLAAASPHTTDPPSFFFFLFRPTVVPA